MFSIYHALFRLNNSVAFLLQKGAIAIRSKSIYACRERWCESLQGHVATLSIVAKLHHIMSLRSGIYQLVPWMGDGTFSGKGGGGPPESGTTRRNFPDSGCFTLIALTSATENPARTSSVGICRYVRDVYRIGELSVR